MVKGGIPWCGLMEAPVPVQSPPLVWTVASALLRKTKETTLPGPPFDVVALALVTGPHF